jgi:Trypsin-like peptidase domain
MKVSAFTVVLAMLAASSASLTDRGDGVSGAAAQQKHRSGGAEGNAGVQVIIPDFPETQGPILRQDFPAICSFPNTIGNPDCTCVLVGRRAALTALHCVRRNNEPITPGRTFRREVEIMGHGVQEEECIPAQTSGLDLAICHVREVRGVPFERVGRFPPRTDLVLTGFGCTEFLQGADGKLSGRSISLSSQPANSSLITLDAPFLCWGDSGGPGFVPLQGGRTEGDRLRGPRLVVGINHSKTQLTSLTTSGAQDFLLFWERDHPDSLICGFNPLAQDCRPL